MNALIFIIILLFEDANISPAGAAIVWAFLFVVEGLADRLAAWLILHARARRTGSI